MNAETAIAHWIVGEWQPLWQAAMPTIAGAVKGMMRASPAIRDLDPNELCQEAALAVGEALPRWDPLRAGFTTYVAAVTRTAVRDYLRRETNAGMASRRARVDVVPLEDIAPPEQDAPPWPDVDIETLTARVLRLAEPARGIILLRFGLDGQPSLSWADIARLTGLSDSTVRLHAVEGLRRLRTRLA